MRSGCEFNPLRSAPAEETPVVIVAGTQPASAGPSTPPISPRLEIHVLSQGPHDAGLKTWWVGQAIGRGQFAFTLSLSCLLHAAAVLYVASPTGLQVFVSEVGRNSVAMVSSQGNNIPANEMEVLLENVELPVSAASVEDSSPAKVNDPREAVAHAFEKLTASAPEVISRLDDLTAELNQFKPAPFPKAMDRVNCEERPPPAAPSRLEKSRFAPPPKPQQAPISAAAIASAGSEPSRGADVDRPPRPVHNPAPEYPSWALTNRLSGRVVLRVRVGADGLVLAAEIHTSSGVAALDEAALRAVRLWRFESALQAGSPVEQEVAVPVRFVMNGAR